MQAADLVVLNKCDLTSLGQLADAEDRLHAIAPGTKIIRARHGQVRAPPAATTVCRLIWLTR